MSYNNDNQIKKVVDSKTSKQRKPINISELEKNYEEVFNKWWNEDNTDVKNFIQQGKILSLRITKARKEKYQFVTFKDFQINISKIPQQISHEELTKPRFFALLHRFIHRKYIRETDETQKNSFKVSALVVKVNFTPNCCLTPIRFLLGTGFEYQHDIVIKNQDNLEDKLSFVIGCMVLDWLSGRSEKNPRNPKVTKYNSFKEYALSEDALTGVVLSAGARGIQDKQLKFLKTKPSTNIMERTLDHITFNMNRTIVSQCIEEFANRMRKAFKKDEDNLDLEEKFGTQAQITEK